MPGSHYIRSWSQRHNPVGGSDKMLRNSSRNVMQFFFMPYCVTWAPVMFCEAGFRAMFSLGNTVIVCGGGFVTAAGDNW